MSLVGGILDPKPLVGGFGCLELVLYGIRVLAEQHYEPSRPMRAKYRWTPTNESEEHFYQCRIQH